MARFRQVACLLLVALWLPATLHCDFEAVGFDHVFRCETSHDAPIADDACDVVESGWIKRASSHFALAAPTLHACLIWLGGNLSAPRDAETIAPIFAESAAPPALARTWQFAMRAALPSRAPSGVS